MVMDTSLICPVCGLGIYESRGEGLRESALRNECRAFLALVHVERHPGASAWELSEKTGIPYLEFSKGLEKARERGWVNTEAEQREGGGIRYRYTAAMTERQEDERLQHSTRIAERRVNG